jgi:hypothetical protein
MAGLLSPDVARHLRGDAEIDRHALMDARFGGLAMLIGFAMLLDTKRGMLARWPVPISDSH